MGVPDLWDIVKPAIRQRVPLSIFAANFHKENKRSLRIAIDSYIWIFETGHIPNSNTPPNPYKVLQGFLSRIWQLISCDISFVVVFDGMLKPSFKQNFILGDDSNLSNFLHLYNKTDYTFTAQNSRTILILKRALDCLNISYIDAAGEAESECSRLQNLGIVDYVLSNDSDAMLFGSDKILRNFSKTYESFEQDEYYVDPVELNEFYTENRIDRFRLIFFAILRGADYNAGVNKVGTERAKRIAFVGTGLNVTAEGCFDFHDLFRDIYYQENNLSTLPNLENVESRYRNFLINVGREVLSKPVDYFGRNETLKLDHMPLYYTALLYFYPILAPSIFKFTPGTLSYLDSTLEEDLKLNHNTIPQLKSFHFEKDEYIRFERFGGGSKGVRGVSRFYHTEKILQHDEETHSIGDKMLSIDLAKLISDIDDNLPNVVNTKAYIVSNFVKCMIPYFLSSSFNRDKIYVKATKMKILPSRAEIGRQTREDFESNSNLLQKWIMKIYMFKYRPAHILKDIYPFFVSGFDDDFEDMVWISDQTVSNLNLTKYTEMFEKTILKRRNSQSSTLESLGFLPSNPQQSPEKSIEKYPLRRNSSIQYSSSKVIKSPRKSPKKSPRKSPKKLAIGQSKITKFFQMHGGQESNLLFIENNNVVSLTDDEDDYDNDMLITIHDIMNTPTKKVPISDNKTSTESPIKGHLGVKKLFVEEDDNDCGESNSPKQLNVLDRIIMESRLTDSSDSD